jgi:hypothetical protein
MKIQKLKTFSPTFNNKYIAFSKREVFLINSYNQL